jgi:hypothetical protein
VVGGRGEECSLFFVGAVHGLCLKRKGGQEREGLEEKKFSSNVYVRRLWEYYINDETKGNDYYRYVEKISFCNSSNTQAR